MTYQSELPGGPQGRRGHSLGRWRDERGVALTEMALVLPLLLLLILGMIDFGKAINYWIDDTHLANQGARLAVVNSNPGGSGQTLQQFLIGHTSSAEQRGTVPGTQRTAHAMTVTICYFTSDTSGNITPTSTPAIGDTVEVIVKYDYQWLRGFPFPGNPTTTLGGKAAMRLEAVPTFNGWNADLGATECQNGP
jgi:Flp pilus assembly protein TadG